MAGLTLTGIDGKVAVVTGAGRMKSIGRSIALELARAGADVVVTGSGRPPERYPDDEQAAGWRDVDSVGEEIEACGRRALPLVSDVGDEGAVRDLLDRTLAEFGRVDFIVNNAGAARGPDRVPVVEMPIDVWDAVLRVNLRGPFLMSKIFGRQLVDAGNGGSIVNISSLAGKSLGPNAAAYVASKAGLQGLTGSMAQEIGRHGVRVNALCPGFVDTSRVADLFEDGEFDARLERIPLGRVGAGEDVAWAAVYLCSDQGSWISGQSINLCGGTVVSR